MDLLHIAELLTFHLLPTVKMFSVSFELKAPQLVASKSSIYNQLSQLVKSTLLHTSHQSVLFYDIIHGRREDCYTILLPELQLQL